jgi:hypothetical protein
MKKKPSRAKKGRSRLSLQDLKRAEMDPKMQYRMQQPNAVPAIITAKDRVMVRQFARKHLQLAKQKDSKMTQGKFEQNLVKVLKRVKPDLRKIMLTQMRADLASDE